MMQKHDPFSLHRSTRDQLVELSNTHHKLVTHVQHTLVVAFQSKTTPRSSPLILPIQWTKHGVQFGENIRWNRLERTHKSKPIAVVENRVEVVENLKHVRQGLEAVDIIVLHCGQNGGALRENLENNRMDLRVAEKNSIMWRTTQNLDGGTDSVNILNALLFRKHATKPLGITDTKQTHIHKSADKTERMSYGLVAGLSNAVLTHSGSISLFSVIVADICSFCGFPVFVGLDEQIEELVQFILAILPTHRKLARNTTAFLSQNAISNAVHSSASFIPVSSQLPLIDTIVKIPEVIFN